MTTIDDDDTIETSPLVSTYFSSPESPASQTAASASVHHEVASCCRR
ncbi:hypothetical protein ACL02S_09465 [Nocardia sp. 004]